MESDDETKVKEILRELGYGGNELLQDSSGFVCTSRRRARDIVYGILLTDEGDFLIWPKHKEEILEIFSKLNKI